MPEEQDQLYSSISETLKKHGIGLPEAPTAKPAAEITKTVGQANDPLYQGITATLSKHGVSMQGQAAPPQGAPEQITPQGALPQGQVARPKMGFSEDESWNPHKDKDFTDKYNTSLPPDQEKRFQEWAKTAKNAAGGTAINDLRSYDVRGRWQELEAMSPEERAKTEVPGAHGPDTWKKPNHPTFSVESKYHGKDGHEGGKWEGEEFTPPDTWKPPQGRPGELPEALAPTRITAPAPPGPPGELGFLDEISHSLARGVGGQLTMPRSIMGAFGIKAGEELAETGERLEREYAPSPSMAGEITKHPSLLLNPRWWASTMPSLAVQLIPVAIGALGGEFVGAAAIGGKIGGALIGVSDAGNRMMQWEKEHNKELPAAEKIIIGLGAGTAGALLPGKVLGSLVGPEGIKASTAIAKIFERKAGQAIATRAVNATMGGGAMAGFNVIENAFEKFGYNPDRQVTQGVLESLILGTAISGIHSEVGLARDRIAKSATAKTEAAKAAELDAWRKNLAEKLQTAHEEAQTNVANYYRGGKGAAIGETREPTQILDEQGRPMPSSLAQAPWEAAQKDPTQRTALEKFRIDQAAKQGIDLEGMDLRTFAGPLEPETPIGGPGYTASEAARGEPPEGPGGAGQPGMVTRTPAPLNPAGGRRPGTPDKASESPPPRNAPPPPEPPSSAPALAGGGGTVGISPTPAGEPKPFTDWIQQLPVNRQILARASDYLSIKGNSLIFDNQLISGDTTTLRIKPKTNELQVKMRGRWNTVSADTLEQWKTQLGVKSAAPDTPMGTPGAASEDIGTKPATTPGTEPGAQPGERDTFKEAEPPAAAGVEAWWDGLSPKEKTAAFYEEYGFKKIPKEYQGAFADLGAEEKEELQALHDLRKDKEAEPSAFGLAATRAPATSRLGQRLSELQAEFPTIDQDRATQVLRNFPDADNNQIANMVGDPEIFKRVAQGGLSAAEQKRIIDQTLPGKQGRLFSAEQEASISRGLTTDFLKTRVGKYGTVTEMTPESLPPDTNRGWEIHEKGGGMVLISEAVDGSLKLGLGETPGPDYAALGIPGAEGRTIAGAHTPLPFNLGSFIELARGAAALDHELWHRVEEYFLTPEERAKVIKKYGDNEEVRAKAYQDWDPKKAPDTIFQKIKDFFTRIIKAITGYANVDDIFAKARSGEMFGREPREGRGETLFSVREDEAETRQTWIERGETPSYNQFKAEMDRNGEELYRRLIMPGGREIPLYQGEKFTSRAGNQIIPKEGAKPIFLSKEEIYNRFFDPKRPLQQPEGTEAVGRSPLLPPEGAVEPPPIQTTQRETPGKIRALRDNWNENMSIRDVSNVADMAHTSIVEHQGWAAREMAKAVDILDKYDGIFREMSREDLMDFTDKAEITEPDELRRQAAAGEFDPQMLQAAETWRRIADGLHFLIADSKGGEFAYWENWFPRMFKNEEQAEIAIRALLQTHGRTMTGPEAMLKARTQLLFSNSIKPVSEGGLGLEPAYDNYIDMMKAKVHESLKYLTGTYIKNDLVDAGFLQRAEGTQKPVGWVELRDKTLRGYYAHPDVAKSLDSFLSKGLRGNALFDAIDNPLSGLRELFVGMSAFHGAFSVLSDLSQGVGSNLTRAIGSALTGRFADAGNHLKNLGMALNTPGNLLMGGKLIEEYRRPGTHPELSAMVDLMQRAGIRVNAQGFLEVWGPKGPVDFSKMSDAFATTLEESKIGIPRKFIRSISWPIMNYLVPRLKINAIARMMDMEMKLFREQNGRAPTRDEETSIAQQVSRKGDDIFGQIVYDNLGMKRAMRDALRIWIGFPGWNIGSGSLILESFKGIGNIIGQTGRAGADLFLGQRPTWEALPRKQRMSMEFYLGMSLVTAVAGSLTMKMLTGEWPTDMKDLFMPRTGGTLANGQPERVRMPTYLRDILSLNHPLEMAAAKSNFALRIFSALAANQDYFGEQIRDPWARAGEQAKQTGEYLAKSFLPFGVQAMMKSETPESKALSLVGIVQVPRRYSNTPAQNVIDEYNKLHRATVTTKEDAATKKLKSDLTKLAQDEDQAGFQDMASDAIAEGRITKQQVKEIVKESQEPPGMSRFTKLPMEWAIRAWNAADDREKEEWAPHFYKKIKNEKPENLIKNREELIKVLDDLGLDEAADKLREYEIPEEAEKMDLSRLGAPKHILAMAGLEEIDMAMTETMEDKLEKMAGILPSRETSGPLAARLPSVTRKEKKDKDRELGL